jgi:hypothetical protein
VFLDCNKSTLAGISVELNSNSNTVIFNCTSATFNNLSSTTYRYGFLEWTQGADVASANNLSLGTDGDSFEITGTTQIHLIVQRRLAKRLKGNTVIYV